MEKEIDLSIIIVAWNVKELVDQCLMKLRKSKDTLKKEILLVDNGSDDGSVAFVKENYPEVILIESSTNLGFIRANNLAYKQAKGKYILMLNSDAFVFKNTLQESVNFMEKTPDCGVSGARLIGTDGKLQPSARFFPTPFKLLLSALGMEGKIPFIKPLDDLDSDHSTVRECDWVVGCYLMIRKSIVDEMGFFLREDYFLYNDDNDLCLRVKQLGWKVFFLPTDVIHIGGANAKKLSKTNKGNQVEKYQLESQYIYFRKNFHVGKAINNLLCIILTDFIKIVKKAVKFKKDETFRELLSHMGLATSIAYRTRFGSRSIH